MQSVSSSSSPQLQIAFLLPLRYSATTAPSPLSPQPSWRVSSSGRQTSSFWVQLSQLLLLLLLLFRCSPSRDLFCCYRSVLLLLFFSAERCCCCCLNHCYCSCCCCCSSSSQSICCCCIVLSLKAVAIVLLLLQFFVVLLTKKKITARPRRDRQGSGERGWEEKALHSGDQGRRRGAFGVAGTGSGEALPAPAPRGWHPYFLLSFRFHFFFWLF